MSLSSVNEAIGRQRWTICALVFAATTINYLDRNVLGLLKPVLSAAGVFGTDKADQELNYANVVICFQIAYALGMLAAGKIIDKVGTKSGYASSLIGWSIAAIGHAFGHHTWSFGFWRAALGVTEAGNFPAANKTIAEWFPKKERAFATGLYNSGANVGAIIAPLCVPQIAKAMGWEWAFILTGVVGFTWLAFWYRLYASPAAKLQSGKLSLAEYNYIHSDVDEQEVEKTDTSINQKSGAFQALFSFKGRTKRGTFWAYSVIITGIGYLGLASFGVILSLLDYEKNVVLFGGVILIACVFGAALLWASLATQARRWHDLGLSAWFVLLSFVPFVGVICFLILGFKRGTDGQNPHGFSNPTLFDWRQTWAFVVGKFLTDPVWWFFLFWLPAFLAGENARKVKEFMAVNSGYTGAESDIPGVISWPFAVAVVYTVSTVGSIFGGWLPKKFINGGMDANKARKLAMFIFALFPLTVLLASRLGAINTWYAVATIAIACAAHQAWSANIFTTVSDMFPKKVIASVTGIGGMAGAVGGIVVARSAGLLFKHYQALDKIEIGYGIMFVICGLAYIIAWTMMHLLVPKFKKIVI